MDFRSDPKGLESGFEKLGKETYDYLDKSHALLKIPIERLAKMNPLAIDLYKNNGIDLYKEPLEVAVCAQHHNGGIAVDSNWQSSIEGLYAAGEAAGTFGASRPGGSALNSSQVGSLRAAEHIAYNTTQNSAYTLDFIDIAKRYTNDLLAEFDLALSHNAGKSNLIDMRNEMSESMSMFAAHIRDIKKITELEGKIKGKLDNFYNEARLQSTEELPILMKNRDILITQTAILSAMIESANKNESRGSALVLRDNGQSLGQKLGGLSYGQPIQSEVNEYIVTEKAAGGFRSYFAPVRELPNTDSWFENVWSDYRKRTLKG